MQSYTNSLGTLSFSYPKNWTTQSLLNNNIDVTNDPTVFDPFPFAEDLKAGQAVIRVTAIPFDLNRPENRFTYNQAIDMAFDELTTWLRISGEMPRETEPYLDHPAIQSRLSDKDFEFYGMAFEIEPNVLVGIALVTAPGELETSIPTLTTLIESMRYTPPPPPVEKGTVAWQYQPLYDADTPSWEKEFFGPVAVGPDNHIYMVGDGLYTWDETGALLPKLDLYVGGMVTDIEVAQDGTIWMVSDSGLSNWEITHTSADGTQLGYFILDYAVGEFSKYEPQLIAVGADGTGYAAFLAEGEAAVETHIWVFPPEFYHKDRVFILDGVGKIRDIRMGPDNLLYVSADNKVRIYDLDGRLVEEKTFVLPGELSFVAVAPDGKLCLTIWMGAILCYDREGNYLYQFGRPLAESDNNESKPLEAGQLGSVLDIAFAPNGDLVVVDYWGGDNGRVMRITFDDN